MKRTTLVISILAIVLLTAVAYKAAVKKKTRAILPNKIVDYYGYKQFPGIPWGLASDVCRRAGYNILDYAGQEIIVERSLAFGKFYYMNPLDIVKLRRGNKLICEYYVQDDCALRCLTVIPGVFAINDPKIWSLM
jgi:hypothetical protein